MYYDENLSFISGIVGSMNRSVQKRTPPNNAKYVIMSYYVSTNYPDRWIKIYSSNSLENQINLINKYLLNKNVLIFGDSISDCCNFSINANNETTSYSWKNPSNSYVNDNDETINYTMWPKFINDNYGCKEVRNYAKSGASYRTQVRESGNERQNLEYQLEVAINDKTNPNNAFIVNDFTPDIVIFFLGTNDTSNDTYEDAMNKTIYIQGTDTIDVDATLNNLDTSNFNEAIRYSFLKVKKEWPMAQIFVVLPIQRADNKDLKVINSQIEEMAKRNSAIIIDGFSNSGITREQNVVNGLGTYLKDGLHPNEKGQNLLTRLIIKEITSKYVDFKNMNI